MNGRVQRNIDILLGLIMAGRNMNRRSKIIRAKKVRADAVNQGHTVAAHKFILGPNK